MVNQMIYDCAKAIAEASVDCSQPVIFKNQEVYYVHECAEGETLEYTGTLPAWITLDADNSRLVGAAGTYSANSQAAANALAQSVIDGFGDQELANGHLACSGGGPCAFDDPTWDAPTITEDFGTALMSTSAKTVTFDVSGTQPDLATGNCSADVYGAVTYNGGPITGDFQLTVTTFADTEDPLEDNVEAYVSIWVNHTPGVDPADYTGALAAVGTSDLLFDVPDSTGTPSTIHFRCLALINFDGVSGGGTGDLVGTAELLCSLPDCPTPTAFPTIMLTNV